MRGLRLVVTVLRLVTSRRLLPRSPAAALPKVAEQLPPHSLQSLRLLPCSQMPLPHRLPCTGCGSDRARSTTAAAALLAHAASPLVMTTADAFAAAVLAEVALPPVLGATTLVGLAAAPPVLAEAQSRPRQRRRTRRTRPNTQNHRPLLKALHESRNTLVPAWELVAKLSHFPTKSIIRPISHYASAEEEAVPLENLAE